MSLAHARPPKTGAIGPVPVVDQICRTVANAPLGPHPVLEAAFAWHESRTIPGWHRPRLGAPPPRDATRYVPITIAHLAAARRIARLLTTLTWPIARPLVETCRDDRSPAVVEVPVDAYYRVSRALAGAWRERWTDVSVQKTAGELRERARVLWRIALLIGGQHHADGLAVRVRTREGLHTLTAGAEHLNLTPIVVHPSRRMILLQDHVPGLRLLHG